MRESQGPRGLLPRRRGTRSAMILLTALGTIVLFSAVAHFAAAQTPGQSVVDREYALKAVYLFNFSRYVTWPDGTFPDEKAPFVIGIVGATPVDSYLEKIASRKRVDGRPLVVRRFANLKDYQPCQILFVGSVTEQQQQAVLQRVGNAPVLVVGETPGFAQHGGIVNFYIANNKIRFEINRTVAEAKDLKISAKLLALARIVGGNGGASVYANQGQLTWHPEPRPQK